MSDWYFMPVAIAAAVLFVVLLMVYIYMKVSGLRETLGDLSYSLPHHRTFDFRPKRERDSNGNDFFEEVGLWSGGCMEFTALAPGNSATKAKIVLLGKENSRRKIVDTVLHLEFDFAEGKLSSGYQRGNVGQAPDYKIENCERTSLMENIECEEQFPLDREVRLVIAWKDDHFRFWSNDCREAIFDRKIYIATEHVFEVLVNGFEEPALRVSDMGAVKTGHSYLGIFAPSSIYWSLEKGTLYWYITGIVEDLVYCCQHICIQMVLVLFFWPDGLSGDLEFGGAGVFLSLLLFPIVVVFVNAVFGRFMMDLNPTLPVDVKQVEHRYINTGGCEYDVKIGLGRGNRGGVWTINDRARRHSESQPGVDRLTRNVDTIYQDFSVSPLRCLLFFAGQAIMNGFVLYNLYEEVRVGDTLKDKNWEDEDFKVFVLSIVAIPVFMGPAHRLGGCFDFWTWEMLSCCQPFMVSEEGSATDGNWSGGWPMVWLRFFFDISINVVMYTQMQILLPLMSVVYSESYSAFVFTALQAGFIFQLDDIDNKKVNLWYGGAHVVHDKQLGLKTLKPYTVSRCDKVFGVIASVAFIILVFVLEFFIIDFQVVENTI